MTMIRLMRTAVALLMTCAVYFSDAYRFSSGGKKVEYYRNYPLSGSTEYDRAVIVIHGFGRNADEYYDSVIEAQNVFPGVGTNTLVVAPRFQTIDDNPEDDELYWSLGGWIYGRGSLDGQDFSSFAVVDGLLEQISSRFPKVTEIVLAGHGAGAQFLQRYAGVGAMLVDLRCDIRIRYVASNPGSYMFPTPERPRSTAGCSEIPFLDDLSRTEDYFYAFGERGIDACPSGTTIITDPYTCTVAAEMVDIQYNSLPTDLQNGNAGLCIIKNLGLTNQRVTMTGNHGSNAAWLCEGEVITSPIPLIGFYDQYRYGVHDLPSGLNYTSLSIPEIQMNLVNREVSLLLGAEDTSRTASPAPDTSCEADSQGLNRYERGMNYRDSIKAFDCTARTTITTVPGIGHDHDGMFKSPQGIMLLFIG